MTILPAALAQIHANARLLAAAGMNTDKIVAQMQDTASLYSEGVACGETAREIRAEAELVEEGANEEFGDSDREIARMLRIVARNLHMIRAGGKIEPVR